MGSKCKDTGPSTFNPLLYGYNNNGKPFMDNIWTNSMGVKL